MDNITYNRVLIDTSLLYSSTLNHSNNYLSNIQTVFRKKLQKTQHLHKTNTFSGEKAVCSCGTLNRVNGCANVSVKYNLISFYQGFFHSFCGSDRIFCLISFFSESFIIFPKMVLQKNNKKVTTTSST